MVDAAAVSAAVRRSLEATGANGSAGKHVTVVVPDAAVRVILLEFDALPHKSAEALPVVRFRLKKLVPFEVDDAPVSYQVMSQEKGLVRVLAVAMPAEVLAEYEAVVREAGYEPGAVLPSTLAALAGFEDAGAVLVVNASPEAVTTAIVKDGVVLLHRSVDMMADAAGPSSEVVIQTAATKEQKMADPVGYDDPVAAAAAMQTREIGRIERQEETIRGAGHEITQAVSVAAAYFEDSLHMVPSTVLTAGATGAESLSELLKGSGLQVREMVETEAIGAGAATHSVRRGRLAGVRGALRG